LWIASRLNVGIEIDFINAGLSLGTWLGTHALERNSTWVSFSNREASPDTMAFWRQRLSTITIFSNLIAETYIRPDSLPST